MNLPRPAPCPRAGCRNPLTNPRDVVCAVDFYALASACRGKKPLGEPTAAMIEGAGGGTAYRCPLCWQWHNVSPMRDREAFTALVAGTVEALRADPRVGPAGLLRLVDAWHPLRCPRGAWREGLDQRQALADLST